MTFLFAIASCTQTGQVDTSFMQLDIWQILVLGIVQGITELLPISSTAHLRIIPSLFGWADPGSAFSAAMQLASLTAVLAFLGTDVSKLLSNATSAIRRRAWNNHSLHIVVGILFGTLPVALAGIALKKILNSCHSPLRALWVIGLACVVMGALLALAERYGQQGNRHKHVWRDLTLRDCCLVGLAQAFALIPGVSRSGSTLTAGLALGMERETAARFSFLLGLPAILLAGGAELATLLKAGLSLEGWGLLAIGLVSASLSAYGALWGLLRYLKQHSSWVFVWYRLLLGVVLILGASSGIFHPQ